MEHNWHDKAVADPRMGGLRICTRCGIEEHRITGYGVYWLQRIADPPHEHAFAVEPECEAVKPA